MVSRIRAEGVDLFFRIHCGFLFPAVLIRVQVFTLPLYCFLATYTNNHDIKILVAATTAISVVISCSPQFCFILSQLRSQAKQGKDMLRYLNLRRFLFINKKCIRHGHHPFLPNLQFPTIPHKYFDEEGSESPGQI